MNGLEIPEENCKEDRPDLSKNKIENVDSCSISAYFFNS